MDSTAVNPIVETLLQPSSQPYSLLRDDVVVCIILGCFLLFALLFADESRSLQQMFRLHSIGHGKTGNEQLHTSRGTYTRTLLLLFSCLSCALLLLCWLCAKGCTASPEMSRHLLWQCLVAVVAYMAGRTLTYLAINGIFFSPRQSAEWTRFCLDLFIFTGMATYLLVVLAVFLTWSATTIVIGAAVVLSAAEIWLVFNANRIFFAKKHGVLLEIVYLCALEWMPLLVLAKVCLSQTALL